MQMDTPQSDLWDEIHLLDNVPRHGAISITSKKKTRDVLILRLFLFFFEFIEY